MNASVSIILPVYNRDRHLGETINSVMRQTYSNWNLIIIDDCSTDQSFNIASDYSAQDRRISVVRMDTNSGNPARPRNLAIQTTDSSFIAFLDSDDIWSPEKLDRQLSFMRVKQSAFSFTGFDIIDEHGDPVGTFNDIPTELNATQYMMNTCLAPSTVIVRRDTATPYFPEDRKTGEDFMAFYHLLKKQNAHGLNEPLTQYRRSNDALSGNVIKNAWQQAKTYSELSREVGIATAGFAYASYALKAFKKRRITKNPTPPGP